MLEDLRQIRTSKIEADLCIIGAGAAGITLARAFIGSNVRVCVLESGGLEFEKATQALYEGEDAGYRQFYNVGESRLRYFGGTTNHWVGHCAPFTETDFEAHSWLPHSGWPIRKEDLDPYFPPAKAICELGADGFDLASFPEKRADLLPFDTSKIAQRVWHMSAPTRFGPKYRGDLESAANVVIYLHANVTELLTSPDLSRVVGATVKTLEGNETNVTARYFVLACGGIENARILLLSNRTAPNGLGNDHDLVGRFYMDQLCLEDAALVVPEDNRLLDTMVGAFERNGLGFEAMLTPSRNTLEKEQTLNWAAEFMTAPFTEDWERALYRLKDAVQSGHWPDHFSDDVWEVISNLGAVAKGVHSRLTARPLSILARSEIAPNPESRITLIADRDALGLHKVRRDLRLTSDVKRTLRSALRLIGEELGRMGAGRIRMADWILTDDEWPSPDKQYAGVHHMGTTRMAADPKHGVVDGNCRVHGVENIYVAGSSVFPTVGYTHPTLPIVALTLRLADHLKARFRTA